MITALKFVDTQSQPYDTGHLYGLTHFSLKDIIDSFSTPVVYTFLYRCLVNYWISVIVFIITIASLIKYKKTSLAAWTLISVIGYFIVMGLTYGDLDNKVLLLHIESEWASISIIIAAGFVFEFLPRIKPTTATWLLATVFAVRLIYIIISLSSFNMRNVVNEQVLAQMRKKGITKLALLNDERLMSINRLSWGLPFETIMMSEMDGDKPQLTFCFINRDDKQALNAITDPKRIYTTFGTTDHNDFNKEYFLLDSTHPYQIMTYDELIK